jgi:hypothetical protein
MRTSFVIALSSLLVGCQSPEAPASSPAPTAASSSNATPQAVAPTTSVHHAGPQAGGVMTTQLPADPNRIPNDAIHAAYRKTPGPSSTRLPSGHPPTGGTSARQAPFAANTPEGETGVAMPLPLVGPGSVDELKRRLVKVPEATTQGVLEQAFRLTFTLDRAKRNPAQAKALLAPLAEDPVSGATASRILGYVAVSQGFDFAGAMKHYGAAVAKDADYGEAHYALAFMHVRGDKSAGKLHFERARALGVPDTRGIARFYPGVAQAGGKQAVDPAK